MEPREAFWSAGIRWPAEGMVVRIVDDEPTPTEFLRAKADKFGNLQIEPSSCPENAPMPIIPRQTARCVWSNGKLMVAHEGHKYEVKTELDLPDMDSAFQKWAIDRRNALLKRNEITVSAYAQVKRDYQYLAVEHVSDPVAEKPAEPDPAPEPPQQQNRHQGKRR